MPYRGPADPCPRCAAPLVEVERADLEVARCSACGGVWVPAAALARLADEEGRRALAAADSIFDVDAAAGRLFAMCPACGKRMTQKMFRRTSGIVVDLCVAHGVWFDATELVAAVRFLESGTRQFARGSRLPPVEKPPPQPRRDPETSEVEEAEVESEAPSAIEDAVRLDHPDKSLDLMAEAGLNVLLFFLG